MSTYVVGIRIPDVRPDDIIQRRDDTISTAPRPRKGIREIIRLLDLQMTRQRNPPGDDDDQDDNQLDRAQQVLQTEPPLQRRGVDEKRRGDAGQSNASLVPPRNLDLRGVEDVLAEDDAVACGPAKQDGVGREHGRGEELGLGVDVFEVVLLTSVPA